MKRVLTSGRSVPAGCNGTPADDRLVAIRLDRWMPTGSPREGGAGELSGIVTEHSAAALGARVVGIEPFDWYCVSFTAPSACDLALCSIQSLAEISSGCCTRRSGRGTTRTAIRFRRSPVTPLSSPLNTNRPEQRRCCTVPDCAGDRRDVVGLGCLTSGRRRLQQRLPAVGYL